MGNKILLVDDDPDFVKLVKDSLEAVGYQVVPVLDGGEALKEVKVQKPDLIILDVVLPQVDGYRICRLLKFDKRSKEIPILMISVRNLSEDSQLAIKCGADDYIPKPLEMDILKEKIKKLLERRKESEEKKKD